LKKLIVFMCVFIFISAHGLFAQENHTANRYLRLGMEQLLMGEYVNAIMNINESLKYDKNHSLPYIIRARAFFELGDMDRTIADCSHVITIDRRSSTAYVIRGNARVIKGEYNRAIADYESALRINPNIEEARQNIELARERMNDG